MPAPQPKRPRKPKPDEGTPDQKRRKPKPPKKSNESEEEEDDESEHLSELSYIDTTSGPKLSRFEGHMQKLIGSFNSLSKFVQANTNARETDLTQVNVTNVKAMHDFTLKVNSHTVDK